MTTRVAGSSLRNLEMLCCVSLLAFAFVLRFPHLGSQSLWADELSTVYWSRLDAGFLLGQGAHIETNPPGYYLLIHAWMQLFGASELSVRLPSVLFSVATVAVVYALARMLFDPKTALVAGLLAAIEPSAVHYAREARQSALLALLEGLALLSLAGYARDSLVGGLRGLLWMGLFVLAAVGAISVHYTATTFVAACFVAIGAYLATTRPFPVREASLWCGAAIAAGVLSMGLLVLANGLRSAPSISWIPPVTRGSIVRFFLTLLSPSLAPGRLKMQLAGASVVVIFCSALPRLRLTRIQFGLLVLAPVAFFLIVVVVSLARPIMLARIGVWLIVPVCVLLARAATVQPTRLRRVGYSAAICAIFIGLLAEYYSSYEKEDWRGAARVVASQPDCGGPIAAEGTPFGITYYEPSLATRSFVWLNWPSGTPLGAGFALASKVLHPALVEARDLSGFLQNNPHAVLVLRPGEQEVLHQLGKPSFDRRLPGGMSVSCF